MFGYRVDIDKTLISSYRSPEEYGEWRAEYSVKIGNIVKKTDKWPDVNSVHDFEVGDEAYLVTATWSSGDSFGWGKNNNTEALYLFKTAKAAFKFKKYLNSLATDKYNYEEVKYIDETENIEVKLPYLPWVGYFESLERIEVTVVFVDED